MVYNAGLNPVCRPRIGQLATPLETRWHEAVDRAFKEMRREDYVSSGIGTMMMSEANLDTISDEIERSKARKAEAERPSEMVEIALRKFAEERDRVLALCERLSAAQKATKPSWDALLMGLDRRLLEPVPINAASLGKVWDGFSQQTHDEVQEQTDRLKLWPPVLQERIEHLERISSYMAQEPGARAMDICKIIVADREALIADRKALGKRVRELESQLRKRKAKPAALAARKAK